MSAGSGNNCVGGVATPCISKKKGFLSLCLLYSTMTLKTKDDARIEYICGAGASFFNIFITFPINKVMFRQQLEGIRTRRALKQIIREGAGNVFRGVLPPLIQRTTTVSLMFGVYSQNIHCLHNHSPVLPSLVSHCLAATGAGFAEAVLVPLERVQCLLQTKEYNQQLKNTHHAFRHIYRFGLLEYYRGLSAVLLRNSFSNIIFFGLKEPLKNSLPTPETQLRESFNAFISGAGLGMTLSTLFFPLNVVKNRMMTSKIGGEFDGIRDTFWKIFKERNYRWRKMFRGVHVNYTRAFISWGIINMTYELLKKLLANNYYYYE